MNKARIRVKVGQGVFSSERSVSFLAGDQQYTLIVDESQVEHKGKDESYLPVFVLANQGEESIIDLPRETFTSGNRIRIPTELLDYAAA